MNRAQDVVEQTIALNNAVDTLNRGGSDLTLDIVEERRAQVVTIRETRTGAVESRDAVWIVVRRQGNVDNRRETREHVTSVEAVSRGQNCANDRYRNMDSSEARALTLLRQALDNPDATFRDGQWRAVEAVVERRARVLVVQRTGWGKSIVYFLATRLLRERGAGFTLLVSPLLALIRNQILSGTRLGLCTASIDSSNRHEWRAVEDAVHADAVDVLLVSPERLGSDEFRRAILLPMAAEIGLVVVDEAHCISDWDHDFRPDYRGIADVLGILEPDVPVVATTATANDRVMADIVEQLGPNLEVIRGPLDRPSLRLQTIDLPGQAERMAWLARHVPDLPGSGIIYTLTVRDARRLADWLRSRGIEAAAYWGELDHESRVLLEQRLLDNDLKALVATPALGLGFDKPDLGFVVHFQRPPSVIHYYQQIGRAGRAVDPAYAVLLGGHDDDRIAEYFIRTAFPEEGHIAAVLGTLQAADGGLTAPELQHRVNLSESQLERTLSFLSSERPKPVGRAGSRWVAEAIDYSLDHARIARVIEQRFIEQARLRAYARSEECLMGYLRRELSDPESSTCGRCAVCAGGPLLPEDYSVDVAAAAARFLRQNDQVIEPRCRWEGRDACGWWGDIPPELRAELGRALCSWGNAGWGPSVGRGKFGAGHFDDALADALSEMVSERWFPEPMPTWVTCVPSLARPKLVPDLARRVARRLRLPFTDCVKKTRETPPQKLSHNSYQQAVNVAGTFSVSRRVRSGPVLLVDDMVSSGWTFTVIAALLRSAGSGPVFPLALAAVRSD